MIISVLGTGESLSEYKDTGHITIGVNNVGAMHRVDYLVIVDTPMVFVKKGTYHEVIQAITKKVFTNLPNEWRPIFSNIEPLKLHPIRGRIDFSNGQTPCSNNSTFVAAALAYKMGATHIRLYGVDLKTHPQFGTHNVVKHNAAIEHFVNLYAFCKKNAVEISVTKQSELSRFIPVH